MTTNRPLRVFLCHSSNDKPAVRELYQKLRAESWIQTWLDEEELYPGQDWNMEIEKAVEAADAIIVCLSKGSITKEGYIQRELRIVLDFADYKPEGTLYIIPVRLEECDPPRRLRAWQYADYFEGQRDRAFQRLIVSLKKRVDSLDLKIEKSVPKREEKAVVEKKVPENKTKPYSNKETKVKEKKLLAETPAPKKDVKPVENIPVIRTPKPHSIATPPNKITLSNGMDFMRVPAGKFLMGSNYGHEDEKPQHIVDIPYDYWMGRYPITNELYNTYIKSEGGKHPVNGWEKKKDHPVVNVSWKDSMAYCQWLNNLFENELPAGRILRLPTESEWEKAVRGTDGREYPWGNIFEKNRSNVPSNPIFGIVNVFINVTTSVRAYSPQGDSPYDCADMTGNVWEWTLSQDKPYPYNAKDGREDVRTSVTKRVMRGGTYFDNVWMARCALRNSHTPNNNNGVDYIGFRVVMCVAAPAFSP